MPDTHSPLPWAVREDSAQFEKIVYTKTSDDQNNGHWFACRVMAGEYRDANAALIVRAVNAHQTLVEACKAADKMIREALPKFDWSASALDANAIRMLNETPGIIAAALALAEGGERRQQAADALKSITGIDPPPHAVDKLAKDLEETK